MRISAPYSSLPLMCVTFNVLAMPLVKYIVCRDVGLAWLQKVWLDGVLSVISVTHLGHDKKTCLWGFLPSKTQASLLSYIYQLEYGNFA